MAGWSANAAGNTRGAKQCPTLPSKCSSIHELTSPDWAGKRAGLKEGQERSSQRSGCLKRKEKNGDWGSGWEAKRQKDQSHARDAELSAWLIKFPSAFPFPVLGRRLKDRLKSDALASCKALSQVRSISINYLLELFSLGGRLEQPAPSQPDPAESLDAGLSGIGGRFRDFSLFTHFNAQSISPPSAPSPPPARAESWDGISENRQ